VAVIILAAIIAAAVVFSNKNLRTRVMPHRDRGKFQASKAPREPASPRAVAMEPVKSDTNVYKSSEMVSSAASPSQNDRESPSNSTSTPSSVPEASSTSHPLLSTQDARVSPSPIQATEAPSHITPYASRPSTNVAPSPDTSSAAPQAPPSVAPRPSMAPRPSYGSSPPSEDSSVAATTSKPALPDGFIPPKFEQTPQRGWTPQAKK